MFLTLTFTLLLTLIDVYKGIAHGNLEAMLNGLVTCITGLVLSPVVSVALNTLFIAPASALLYIDIIKTSSLLREELKKSCQSLTIKSNIAGR